MSLILLRILSLILLLCVCAVPVLETAVFSLQERMVDLENKRQMLRVEISSLLYLRKTLERLEVEEKALRAYFGMEQYTSLDQILGRGGIPDQYIQDLDHVRSEGSEIEIEKSRIVQGSLPLKLDLLESNYKILDDLAKEKDKAWRSIPNITPLEMEHPQVSSIFGFRKNPFTQKNEFHAGIDFKGDKSIKVIAPADGKVINTGYDKWLGNYIVLQHNERIKTIYGHLHKVSVENGMSVRRGDELGLMGNTGLSTSTHLHYSVIKNDRAVNPMEFILDRRGS